MSRLPLGRGKGLLVIGLAILFAPALAGCSSTPSIPAGKVGAVAGENFYGDLISRVGGDLVVVTSLLNDPNVDPHTYESSPSNAQAVADASLVVENGLGYDAFLGHLVEASPRSDRHVIDVGQMLGLGDDANPHLWYDPATMPKVARAVADALEALKPESKAAIEADLAAYLDSFAPLTARIAEVKRSFPATPVTYTEPVPGYLLAALGFQVKTPAGFARAIENGTDPAPLDVAAQIDLLNGHQVKILLYNSQATSPVTENIKTLAHDSGVPVVGMSETMPGGATGYVGWQLAQIDAIETALGGSK